LERSFRYKELIMARKKEFNEEEALDKARELFWNKGFYDTSIQDLVNTLGINRGSLYDTYGGKKELFYASLNLHQSRNLTFLRAFLEKNKDVKNGLKLFFERIVNSIIDDVSNKGCFIVNSTMELLPSDEKVTELVTTYRNSVQQSFFDYLEKGKKTGQLQSSLDSQCVSSLLCTLLMGIRVSGKIVRDKNELLGTVNYTLNNIN